MKNASIFTVVWCLSFYIVNCKVTAEVVHNQSEKPKTLMVIDSGVDSTHAVLQHLIKKEINFTTDKVRDRHGHGTSVAGVAAKCGFRSIISCKAQHDNGLAYRDDILDCIEEAIRLKVSAINTSQGGIVPSKRYIEIAKRVKASGIRWTASGGNRGRSNYKPRQNRGLCSYPAQTEGVISVGALYKGKPADYTSFKCQHEKWQEGCHLTAKRGGGWHTVCGTSFAAPQEACAILK